MSMNRTFINTDDQSFLRSINNNNDNDNDNNDNYDYDKYELMLKDIDYTINGTIFNIDNNRPMYVTQYQTTILLHLFEEKYNLTQRRFNEKEFVYYYNFRNNHSPLFNNINNKYYNSLFNDLQIRAKYFIDQYINSNNTSIDDHIYIEDSHGRILWSILNYLELSNKLGLFKKLCMVTYDKYTSLWQRFIFPKKTKIITETNIIKFIYKNYKNKKQKLNDYYFINSDPTNNQLLKETLNIIKTNSKIHNINICISFYVEFINEKDYCKLLKKLLSSYNPLLDSKYFISFYFNNRMLQNIKL